MKFIKKVIFLIFVASILSQGVSLEVEAKENFDEEEKNLMQEIMGKTLQELDYLN